MSNQRPNEGPAPPPYADHIQAVHRRLADLNIDKNTSAALPSSDECLAHLKLLECFNQLRDDIGATDGLFGIRNEFVPPGLSAEQRDVLLIKLCEKRWEVYVTRACTRFQSWWRAVEPGSRMLVEDDLKHRMYASITANCKPIYFDTGNLPSIDILMVYHAFMLNPRTFLADCIRHGKMGLWAAGMPWQAVASAIDNTTFKYSPDKACRDNFERLSRRSWDNLDEPPYIPLKCPHCSSPIRAPWTTIDSASAWEGQSAGEVGRGFADRGFRLLCSCGVEMNHQLLRTRKFVGDMRALFSNHVPMPGTFLTVFGIPDVASKDAPGGGVFPMTFPNRLLKAGAAKKIARVCSTRKFYKASMNDVLVQIKAATDDKEILRKAMLLRSTDASLFKRERLAVRRMMSSYWDNSSMFSMDLVGAVIRQTSFTSKMHAIDWLHSPAATSTMKRLVSKYENYFAIMTRYSTRVVVPCLDVDLAWHTHQTTPASYFLWSVEKTGVFIDHDDKIGEDDLAESFEWTSKTYQEMFNKPYSECTCWYCEALREDIPYDEATYESTRSKLKGLFKSDRDKASGDSRLHPPMAHISAHSAVKTGRDNPEIVMARLVRTRQLDRSFQILSNIAEKQGKDPPSRDDFNKEHTWGHHEPVSADHMPYERNPHIHDGLYVTDPACISAAGECYSGPSNRDPGVPMGQNMLSLGCRTNNTSTSMNIAGPDGSALCGAGVCGSRGGGCIGSSDCGSRVPPGFGRGAAELAGQVIGGVLGASLCGGGGGGGGG